MPNGDGNAPSQPTPPQGGPNLDTTATGGMSGLGEGWGAGTSTVGEVFDNIKAVFEGMKGEILKAWLAVAAIMFLVESVEVVLYVFVEMTGALGALVAIFAWPIAVLIYFLGFFATAAQLSLFGPLRDKVFHGIEPDSWMDALRAQSGRYWSVLGTVVAISFAIPCLCVIPGLIAAFFGVMAPYLAATEDIGVFDAFKKSYERTKAHWPVIAVTIAALIVGSGVASCFISAGGFVAGALPDVPGIMARNYAFWGGVTVLQLLLFVIWGGVYMTVDAAETGQSVHR